MPYSVRPTSEVDLAAEFQAARARALVDSRNEPTSLQSPRASVGWVAALLIILAGLLALAIRFCLYHRFF